MQLSLILSKMLENINNSFIFVFVISKEYLSIYYDDNCSIISGLCYSEWVSEIIPKTMIPLPFSDDDGDDGICISMSRKWFLKFHN